jgi:tetratricopeptide (TPR) repeat protein
MGYILVELGELDEALEAYERTLLVQEQVFGNPALQMSNVLYRISDVHTRLGRHEDAVPPLQRAVALIEQDLGLHTPRVVFLLARLGHALMNAGRGDEAIEVLERALSLCDPPQGVVDCAEAGFLLAQALGVGQAEERAEERALALAERSREQYLACSADHRETINRIEQWIRTHRR